MKTHAVKFLFIIILFISQNLYSQSWTCGVSEVTNEPMYIGTATHNLVVIYLDFPDGRYNGQPPEDSYIPYVESLLPPCQGR